MGRSHCYQQHSGDKTVTETFYCCYCGLVVTMAKNKKNKKKGTAKPDKKRQSIPIEIKQLAIEMYDQKKKNSEIIAMIWRRYKKKVIASTVATWYHPKNRAKIMALGVDKITSKEVRINQQQMTRLMIDMEHFLVMYIERQQDNSIPMTTKCIQGQALLLYDKLVATRIYSNKGQCLTELKGALADRQTYRLTDRKTDRQTE